jgi:hydrogenase-4 component F
MSVLFWSILFIPLIGSVILYGCQKPSLGCNLNFLFSFVAFVLVMILTYGFWHYENYVYSFCAKQFYLDSISLLLLCLVAFISMTTAWFSRTYMLQNFLENRITAKRLRLYNALYQLFVLTMFMALLANNLGILWVSLEGATLTTVLLVSLYRTPEAIEAAWKYFILCIVGIALALFGTVLVYFSAQMIVNAHDAILWSEIAKHANKLNGTILTLAFVFIFVGYGTKIGLVPLHNWLPDAHSESPGPMSTLLSGLLLNIALYALLRFKILIDLAIANNIADKLFIGFGLLSLLFASLALYRQNNIKRLFSYSSIEHMGLITFAFGISSPLANFAGLLYIVMHALTKSAIFTTVGNIIHVLHTQSIDKIKALLEVKPNLGWIFLFLICAIIGLPPFGIFNSELLVILATAYTYPWLLIFVILGLILALVGLLRNLQSTLFGKAETNTVLTTTHISIAPAILHVLIILAFGLFLPSFMGDWLTKAAHIISYGVV